MRAGELRVPFRRDRQAAGFPVGLCGKSFLFSADVDPCGVDFVVAGGLEAVEELAEVVDRGDSGASGFVRPDGHTTEEDSGLRRGWWDERHFGSYSSVWRAFGVCTSGWEVIAAGMAPDMLWWGGGVVGRH